jgi:hypothetical protein
VRRAEAEAEAAAEAEGRPEAEAEAAELLLWSLLQLLAKYDGVLDGSGGDESAAELLATMRRGEGAAAAAAAAASPLARPQPSAEAQLAASARLEALLLVGERDAACEHAMASGLWADALLTRTPSPSPSPSPSP